MTPSVQQRTQTSPPYRAGPTSVTYVPPSAISACACARPAPPQPRARPGALSTSPGARNLRHVAASSHVTSWGA